MNSLLLLFTLALGAHSVLSIPSAEAAIAEPVPPEQRMHVEPVLDVPLRDPAICRGPDHAFYLTGTLSFQDEGEDFANNAGIRVWKSHDLGNWEDLGIVWTVGLRNDAHRWVTRPMGDADTLGSPRHDSGIIAPEIHYLKGIFWLAFSRNNMGTGLLRSTSGKAEGPYEATAPSSRITHWGRDPSLFEDDDGAVYWLWSGPQVFIARMKPDLSGLAEAPASCFANIRTRRRRSRLDRRRLSRSRRSTHR